MLRCLIPQSPAVTAPDGSPSPLSLRDISPHRGVSPFTREPNLIPQSTHFVRRQLLTGESPLCRSATFPHTVGNHPFQGSLNKSLSLLTSFADSSLFKGAYLSPLFLPENHRKNVQNRVQYLSKSSKLENVNNLFIILQQHCQFCLPLLPKNNNSICSIQKINKFV